MRRTSARRSPTTSATSGASAFGGPIVKDKVHFYSAIEYQTENKSFTVNSGQPQFYSKLEGVFPTNYLRHKYFVRGDWQVTQSQALFVRYGKDWEHIDCEGCGGTNAAFNQSYVESPRTTNVVGHTWVVSNRALNEFRVQYPRGLHSTTGPPGTSLWEQPGRVPGRAVRPATRRSTTSRACTGDRTPAA